MEFAPSRTHFGSTARLTRCTKSLFLSTFPAYSFVGRKFVLPVLSGARTWLS